MRTADSDVTMTITKQKLILYRDMLFLLLEHHGKCRLCQRLIL